MRWTCCFVKGLEKLKLVWRKVKKKLKTEKIKICHEEQQSAKMKTKKEEDKGKKWKTVMTMKHVK